MGLTNSSFDPTRRPKIETCCATSRSSFFLFIYNLCPGAIGHASLPQSEPWNSYLGSGIRRCFHATNYLFRERDPLGIVLAFEGAVFPPGSYTWMKPDILFVLRHTPKKD